LGITPGLKKLNKLKLIVGLGNPGLRYRNTRHNAGFMVVDLLARRHGVKVRKKRYYSRVGEGVINNVPVALAKPDCFMNISGRAVEALLEGFNLGVEDIIIVHDDIDIASGKIKVKHGGGDAGHKGIGSVIGRLGTGEFTRIRVGVGRPASGEDVVNYVLGKFGPEELSLLRPALTIAADAVESMLPVANGR